MIIRKAELEDAENLLNMLKQLDNETKYIFKEFILIAIEI